MQTIPGLAAYDIDYAYDADNRVIEVQLPGGYDTKRNYDGMGRLSTLGKINNPNTAIAQYFYDDASNIIQRSTFSNGASIVTPHDAMNRMIRRNVNLSGATISQEIYGYDQMSRMLSLDRIEDGLTRRDLFGYNPAGELTSAKYDLVNNVNPNRTVSYALDNVGNRTSVNENGVATAYVPDNINRYSSIGGYPVGSGGAHQMISYQGESYAFIGDTYLARMTSGDGHNLTLGYDALGRCVQRTLDGAITYYLYDGEKPIQEVGATLASNLYGAGIDEILERDVPGNVYYFFQDHEGSVTHVADLGGLTERYRYDAFGAPTIKAPFGAVRSASLIGNRFLFTGREYDEDFGIYEYRARAYSPYSGRFMTEDPKGFAAGDYNLFRYCKNDPLDLVDPMGLYGRPLNEWTDDQWDKFKQNQKAAIQIDIAAKSAIDHAIADGKDKASKAVNKAFNDVLGRADQQTMQKVSDGLGKRINALQDDGEHGYWAHPTTDQQIKALGKDPNRTVAYTHVMDKNIYVNQGHGWSDRTLTWATDHEAGHSATGFRDYAYMHEKHRWNYNAMSMQNRLMNADSETALAHMTGE